MGKNKVISGDFGEGIKDALADMYDMGFKAGIRASISALEHIHNNTDINTQNEE